MIQFLKNKKSLIIIVAVVVVMSTIMIPAGFARAEEGDFFGIGAAIYGLFEKAVLGVSVVMLTLGALVLGLAGLLLDAVMNYTVVEMAANINGNLAPVIRASWTAFRDIANMVFIFILLYISIGTILGLGGIDMKRTLTRVIIVALLLNFSLFFTKIVVDGSNIVSTVFYNEIIEQNPPNAGTLSGGVSGAFMQKFGLTSLWDPANASRVITGVDPDSTTPGTPNTATRMFLLGFLGMIFMGIAAFVFYTISFMFISRFVIIIFLFILSPLAFAAMALPKDKYSGRWWNSLLDQAMFAPACLALLWVVTQILDGIIPTNTANIGGAITAQSGTLLSGAGTTIMNFVIAIAFMLGALIIAKQSSAYGAFGIVKAGDKLRKNIQGQFGRGAVRVTGLNKLDQRFGDSEFGKSRVGRGLRSITTGAITNADFGSGKSVQKVDKEVKKKNEEYVKTIEKNVEKKFDKDLPQLRAARIAEIDKRNTEINTEIASAEKERRDLEAKLRAASADGLAIPAADVADAEKKINDAKTKINTLTQEKGRITKEQQDMRERMTETLVATKDEKNKWLRTRQKERADELNPKRTGVVAKKVADILTPNHRKMAAKKLRENARGGGSKDTKKILEEILTESGEITPSSASDSSGAPKP